MSSAPVIITGGAQRLGLAAAQSLNAQGYRVVITYRSERPILEDLRSQGITCHQADFATDAGIDAFIQLITSEYPEIRALIHNASTWSPDPKPFDFQDASKVFENMMQVHAKTPFLINKALTEHIVENGDILHISDQVAQVGSMKHIAYASSKAALESLTVSFARQLAPKIKVNTIAPALIIFNEWDDEEYRKKSLQKSLLGIEPGVQCFTDTVKYLLENNYITGRVLPLDGGRHLKLP